MHVGALVISRGRTFARGLLRAHRVAAVARAALPAEARLPRFEMGRPFWVDDHFNLDYHVRHTGLPSPGSIAQLRQLVGRIFSQRLDRSKPLWEVWLVQSLEDGASRSSRDASRTGRRHLRGGHLHRAVRPIAGAGRGPSRRDGWTAERAVAGPARDRGHQGVCCGRRANSWAAPPAVQRPSQAASDVREAAEGIGEVVWAGLNAAPDVPLNVPSARTGDCGGCSARSPSSRASRTHSGAR